MALSATSGKALLGRSFRGTKDRRTLIVDALDAQRCTDFTLDGEVVAFSRGRTECARSSHASNSA
ncbi:hypothetical protein ACIPC1_12935 [Streptomyces sp. NPDC087263]|uniref:hypothetical protein n=1 Tax=Streptomyces sp. NPDC087263 TaxID=3365773 RepID=UPI003813D709